MDKDSRKELSNMAVKDLVGLFHMRDDSCECLVDCSCPEPHLLTPGGVELYPMDAGTILIEIRDALKQMNFSAAT